MLVDARDASGIDGFSRTASLMDRVLDGAILARRKLMSVIGIVMTAEEAIRRPYAVRHRRWSGLSLRDC